MWKSAKAFLLPISLTALLFLNGCGQLVDNGQASLVKASTGQGEQTASQEGSTMQMATDVVVAYSLDNSQLTLHEPAFLNFTVQNNMALPVKLDLGQDRKESFRFTVVQPDGTRTQLPQWRRDGISQIGRLSLEPRQSYTQKLLLNEWFAFSTPGKYEVEINLASPVQTQEGRALATQMAGHVTLEMGPRSAEHLKRISAALLDKIMKAPSYKEASESALALSYIEDPIAVPDLDKALTSGRMVESIAITGLERIGNDEAIEVLISTLKNQDVETAQLARSALTRIEQRNSAPSLKENIRRALSESPAAQR